MNLQRSKKMANPRRSDYGEEFVERLRKDRFRKAYILVNGINSGDEEEDEEELCFEDEDDEIASYVLDSSRRPPSVHSSRRPPSVAHSQRGGAFGFDARDLYFFGVLSELSDKFTPERTARLIAKNAPPADFRSLGSIERVAYLLYFSLYGKYLSVGRFHNVFNREFFKYTSAGDSERVAFLKICRITLEEYKRRAIEQNKRAYKLSQKHLFGDERATPDSRMSDRPSMESEEMNSIDSLAKELMFYRSPHVPVRFGRGGKIIYVDPTRSVSTVCVEDLKRFFRDTEGKRYVELLESFKGPILVGHTPPQTPLLFIQCQINRLLQSDVYRANPSSSDANDCLLIWGLLEMLIRQHGKVTGPDLASLLCSNQPTHLATLQKSFLKSDADFVRGASTISRQDSGDAELNSDLSSSALDRMTNFLLGGHIDEAIDSAISEGFLFDALLLAHRLFGNDRNRLDAVEARLMTLRSPQHPITTLLSVAADQPVPLLTNPTSYETNGWRSHIAIVLANLQSPTAMNAVYQLGLALAHKEFNSAADFCFLAVNLLSGFDCFHRNQAEKEEETHRQSIRLINTTLPDDESYLFISRFGWSILDYQATELFDYALQLANPNSLTSLSKSSHYTKARLQYAQLLDELGGFKNAVELYRSATLSTTRQHESTMREKQDTAVVGSGYISDGSEDTVQQPQRLNQLNAMHKRSIEEKNEHRSRTDGLFSGGEEVEEKDDPNHNRFIDVNARHEYARQEVGFPEVLMPSVPPPIPEVLMPPVPIPEVLVPPEPNKNIIKPKPIDSTESWLPVQPDHPSGSFVDNLGPGQVVSQQSLVYARMDELQAALPSEDDTMMGDKAQTGGMVESKQSAKTAPTAAGGKGFLRGFLSKIKAPAEKTNEMKLPEDKDPKIVWDSQLGRYIDQEQEQQPQEELAPPPIIPTYQSQQWQQATQPTEQQQRPPAPPTTSRAFQGKSRYANAWNS